LKELGITEKRKLVCGMKELNEAFKDGWILEKKTDPGKYPGHFKVVRKDSGTLKD